MWTTGVRCVDDGCEVCGRQGRRLGGYPTTNDPSGEPVAWVGKTPLRPLARPQDRSGSPTFGREASRGESSRLQTQAPLHHQPPTTLRENQYKGGFPSFVRASPPTTNPSGDARWDALLPRRALRASLPLLCFTSYLRSCTLAQYCFTTNH
ncbi:MAG: hypothetical protein ACHBN1_13985 [Heteroscytonema crispum UTEX LB 1556]